METRSAKNPRPLSEAELEEHRLQLAKKENQLREQAAHFERRREEFELEKHEVEQEMNLIREGLTAREQELTGRTASTSEPQAAPLNMHNELIREIDYLRAEVERIKGIGSPRTHGPGLHERFGYSDNPNDSLAPRVSYREALEAVPSFDGRNVTLNQFLQACRRAKDLLPPSSERNLTRLLINKLRGRAYSAVEDEPCDTITQLGDLLSSAFGSAKTIDQYRGELSCIHLLPREHILDYIGRVKTLRGSIIDAERRSRGITQDFAREIDMFTARSFCEGLPLEFRLQLGTDHYKDPFAAFSRAKELAARREKDLERFGGITRSESLPERTPPSSPKGTAPPRNYAPAYTRREFERGPLVSRPPPLQPRMNTYPISQTSRIGNTSWRTSDNRDRGSPRPYAPRDVTRAENRHDTSHRQYPRADDSSVKICRYCKARGHVIEECRKRQYNNSRREQGNGNPPPGTADGPRAGIPRESTRPVNAISENPTGNSASQ